VSAYTDPVGHGVDQQFRLRQLEQQAANTDQTSDTTTSGR
jgi:hypothetical protein